MYLFIGGISFLLTLFDVLYKRWSSVSKLYWYIVFTIFIFLIVGFRNCGFDFDNYLYYYHYLDSEAWDNNAGAFGVEIGYAFLNYICCSYRQLLVVMAFATIGLYSYFIYKNSPLPFFSLFLLLATFIYPFAMGQYRQALAIAIVLLASLYKEKRVILLCLLGLASLFHLSSLLAILLLFISDKIYPRRVYLIFLLFALVSNLFLYSFFFQSLNILPEIAMKKLGFYMYAEQNLSYGLNFAMLLRVVTFFLFWYRKDSILQFKYGGYFFNIYFLSLLLYLGLGFLPQLAGRGSIYFYFYELILAGMVVSKENKLKLLIAFFFLCISIYRQITFFAEWKYDFIPYKSDLNNFIGL